VLAGTLLRRFNEWDLYSVIEINRWCLPENYVPSFFIETFRRCPSAFIVAEMGGQLIGYIMCRMEGGFSNIVRFKFVQKGHIISVAVLPEYRQRGIGSGLVGAVMRVLRGIGADECYLEVRETNDGAMGLYGKLGFSRARVIPRYYANSADAVLMVRSLS